MAFTKKIPLENGWYWMKYRAGDDGLLTCPARVYWNKKTVQVTSAYNTWFIAGPDHGGPELKYNGRVDRSIRFGPRIEEPK